MKDLFWLTEEQMERLRPVFRNRPGCRGRMTGGSCLIEVKWSVQRVPSGGSVSGKGGLERLAAATGVWLVDDDECLCEQLLPGGRHHVASRGTSSQEYSARAFAVCRRTSSGMQSSAAKIFCASTSISV